MTMIRPSASAAVSIGHRLVDSVTAKTVIAVTLGLAGWHYTEIGDLKDLRGDVKTIRQQNSDQETRMEIQREAIGRKLDRDTYDRDVRNMTESLNRIQMSIDNIHATLERH